MVTILYKLYSTITMANLFRVYSFDLNTDFDQKNRIRSRPNIIAMNLHMEYWWQRPSKCTKLALKRFSCQGAANFTYEKLEKIFV